MLAATRGLGQDELVPQDFEGEAVTETATAASAPNAATPRLRLGALTARILGGTRETPPELHLDEVRVLAPATFARVSFAPGDELQVLRAPDICVVPPGQRVYLRVDPASEAILAALDTLACEERSIRVNGRPARVAAPRTGSDGKLRETLDGIALDLRHGRGLDGDEGDARASELALHLASAYGTSEPPSNCAGLTRPRLERVLALIDERLTEALPVSELAEAVHLSPFHFSRMFRVSTGRSPHEWIMLKRMARAKALLASTRMPLPEVAKASGYRTHSHFSGMFHAVVGITPGQYRARHS